MSVEEFVEEWNNSSPFITAHTSGSTGKPKPVLLPKKLVAESALRTVRFFNLSEKSLLYLPLSVDYIAGKMMVVRSLLSGARLLREEPTNAPLRDYNGERISLIAVVPSQLPSLLENPSSRLIDCMIVGGAPVDEAMAAKLRSSGIEAFETYGMTETASHVALRRLSPLPADLFTTLPGIKVALSEDSTLDIIFPGNKIVRTRDIAEIHGEERFRILGRADHAIITGALKVHPAEVERKIGSLPVDRQWYVSGKKDEKWGEKVVIVVEGAPMRAEEEKGILEAIRRKISNVEMPREFIYIPQFEKTSSGKIKRIKFE